MRGGWQEKTYWGGRFTPIADLLKSGSHTLESWGNAADGWWPYLVKAGSGIRVGPYFTTLRDLKEAAARAYGIQPGDVKRGRNW